MTPLRSALSTSASIAAACTSSRSASSEPLGIDAEGLRVADEVVELQLVLVGEQPVVHLPEASLRAGRLHRLGGELGVRVDVASGRWRKT